MRTVHARLEGDGRLPEDKGRKPLAGWGSPKSSLNAIWRRHPRTLGGALAVLWLFLAVPGLAATASPKDKTPPPDPRRQPGPVIATRIDGAPATVEQDLSFAVFRFTDPALPREARHKIYKKLPLVVSELTEPDLLAKGYYVLRLMPGATVEKWSAFVSYMRGDPAVSYVGRVFSQKNAENLTDLLVAAEEIDVGFSTPPTQDGMEAVGSRYPLQFESADPMARTARYRVRDPGVEPVDLAQRLNDGGEFAWAAPVLLRVKGRPVTEDRKNEVLKGYMDSAPAEVKEKLRQNFLQRRKELQEKFEKEKGQPSEKPKAP